MSILKVGENKAHVDNFIQYVVRRMKKMGVAYQKKINKNFKIAESDVTKGSIAKMDINSIMTHIEQYETAVAGGDLDISTIQTLSGLYQRGIEYYSAFDNTTFGDLLNRMQSLL